MQVGNLVTEKYMWESVQVYVINRKLKIQTLENHKACRISK